MNAHQRQRCLLGLAASLFLLMPRPGLAQLRVQLKVEHDQFLQYESIMASLTIANDTAIDAELGRYEENARVSIQLQRAAGDSASSFVESPAALNTVIKPGKQATLDVDASQLFDMREERRYLLQASVLWRGRTYNSEAVVLDVVSGIVVESVRRGLPQRPEIERDYVLRYVERDRHEHLLLSVLERSQNVSLGVFDLGPVVRVYRPEIKFDNTGNVRIIHHSGNDANTHSFFFSDEKGFRFLNQQQRTLADEQIEDTPPQAPPPEPQEAPKTPVKKNKVDR